MKLISTDPETPGVFAFGQLAQGIFAFGQMATGVVAVGQVARGIVAVGQLAVGIVAVGQGAVGVWHAVAMLGLGGRGAGGVLKWRPAPARPPARPAETPLASLVSGEVAQGWVRVELQGNGEATRATHGGVPLEADVWLVQQQLGTAAAAGERDGVLSLRAEAAPAPDAVGYRDAPPSRVRLQAVAATFWPRVRSPTLAALQHEWHHRPWMLALRGLVLAVSATVFWFVAGDPVVEIVQQVLEP